MKKISKILIALFIVSTLALASCRTVKSPCPAYETSKNVEQLY